MRDVATIDFINFPGTLNSEIGLCQFRRLFYRVLNYLQPSMYSGYSVVGDAYIKYQQKGWSKSHQRTLEVFWSNTVGSRGFIGSQFSHRADNTPVRSIYTHNTRCGGRDVNVTLSQTGIPQFVGQVFADRSKNAHLVCAEVTTFPSVFVIPKIGAIDLPFVACLPVSRRIYNPSLH